MKFSKAVSALSLTALLGVSSYAVTASAQDKIKVINPASNWAVTKIDQGAEPYCTLVRQYEGGVVITLGQNINEEYSIALDFQKPTFDPEESYSMTLQPGPGQLRAYEMMPASPGAMVVRLGWDDSFLSALADSQMLKAEIDGAEYNFDFPDFANGEKDLDACMDALKNPEAPVVAEVEEVKATPPRQDFSAKKKEAEPSPVEVKAPKAQPPKVVPKVATPAVDTAQLDKLANELSAAKSEAGRLTQALASEKQKYELLQQTIARDEGAQNQVKEQVAALQTENKALREQMNAQTEAGKISEEQKAALDKMQQEVASLTEQNKSLSTALQQKQAGAAQDAEAKDVEVAALTEKLKMMEAENGALKTAAEANKAAADAAAQKGSDVDKLREDLAAALNEKNTLLAELSSVKTQLTAQETVSKETASKSTADSAELEKLKADLAAAAAEKDTLLKDLADAKTKLAEVEQKSAETDQASTDATAGLEKELSETKADLATKEKELADLIQKQNEVDEAAQKATNEKAIALEKRVAELEVENKKYYEDAKQARSEIDQAKIDIGNQAFQNTKKLEGKLEAAMADNISLTKQVEELTRMQDEVAVGISDSDWNLEKATRRYNQAEKEVRRLGALLEQQRGSCRAEAKELEDMLFDPAVTDKKQREQLARLEEELADARRQLRRAGVAPKSSTSERVTVREDRSSKLSPMPSVPAEPVQRVSEAPKVAPVAPKAEPKKVATPVAKASIGQGEIQTILQSSGIGASRVSAAGANAYRWSTQNMSGYAQVTPKSSAGDVVQYAQNYINQQRARCQGDFASVPGSSERGKATYELACVGGNTSTSSSIVFFEKGNDVALISHQTSADDMDVAMDARDKVASQIR